MKHSIDGNLFRSLLESGANNLSNHFEEIDALNVFPVPDGDTGTNMNMTFTSGVADCLKTKSDHVGDLAKILSKGLLMGARGNSGVILSQIFRGFAQAVEGKGSISVSDLAQALDNGAKVAYKAVMRPVEGTILTVIRESSANGLKYLDEHPDIDLYGFMVNYLQFAKKSLANTPNLLPVLKEVGVVDSGGAGLVTIIEGFLSALDGKVISLARDTTKVVHNAANLESEEFGYCTEFIVQLTDNTLKSFKEDVLRDTLSKLGESIVVVQDEDIVKVHIHTLKPGDVLNKAQKYGEFLKLKIENMSVQHENIVNEHQPKKKYALVGVASGDGLSTAFKELRCEYIITGGQTMNPSTEDFVAMIKKANAENVIVLPNNSNIIMAAKQAAEAFEDSNVVVLETKTIPQGLNACIMFNPESGLQDNIEEMQAAVNKTVSGAVTYAIKDTSYNGLQINENDYIGILDKNIVVSNPDKLETIWRLLDAMITKKHEILTIIAGEDSSQDELTQITDYVEEEFSVEVEVIKGDQPVYSYLFGVE
jgi:uncharacterized protein